MLFSSPSSIVRCRRPTQAIPITFAVSSFPFSHIQTGFSHFLSLIKIMIVKTFQTLYFRNPLVKSSCLQLFARNPQPRELQLLFWFSALYWPNSLWLCRGLGWLCYSEDCMQTSLNPVINLQHWTLPSMCSRGMLFTCLRAMGTSWRELNLENDALWISHEAPHSC